MNNISKTVTFCAALVTLAFASPQTKAQEQVGAPTSPSSLATAPTWTNDVLANARTCAYCRLDDRIRAEILGLSNLSDAQVQTYASRRAEPGITNRQYHTSRGVLTIRDVDGYMSFGTAAGPPPMNKDTSSRIPGGAEVIRLGQDLATRLGLPQDEISGVEVHGMAASGRSILGPTPAVTVGRIVEFSRHINGHRVLESGARFEFGLDGVLNRVKVRWPQFKMRPESTRVRKRDAVLAEAAVLVGEAKVKRIEVAYSIGDDGLATPVLLIEAEGQQDKLVMPQRNLVPLAE